MLENVEPSSPAGFLGKIRKQADHGKREGFQMLEIFELALERRRLAATRIVDFIEPRLNLSS